MEDVVVMSSALHTKRKRRREDKNGAGQTQRKKAARVCTTKGCAELRAKGASKCADHCLRCEVCNTPVVRGKWCKACKDRKEQLERMCTKKGCKAERMSRQPTCFEHTLTCRRCKQPVTRGKPCVNCKKSKKDGNPRWYHESLAKRVFEHAFWKNKAPPCACSKRKTKCTTCTAIETCRVRYKYKGRSRWFDFDIVFKVPIKDASGETRWKIVLVVEVDGPSHYKSIKFGKASSDINDQRLRDKLKQRYCRREKIHLIRIPCYFGNPNGKMYPNTKKFIKLVHIKVWEAHEKLSSGALGTEARAMLRKHWRDDWFRHTDARV